MAQRRRTSRTRRDYFNKVHRVRGRERCYCADCYHDALRLAGRTPPHQLRKVIVAEHDDTTGALALMPESA
jgi:hypothetical protein